MELFLPLIRMALDEVTGYARSQPSSPTDVLYDAALQLQAALTLPLHGDGKAMDDQAFTCLGEMDRAGVGDPDSATLSHLSMN